MYKLFWTEKAKKQYKIIKNDKALEKRYKSVKKALSYLKNNPRHPGLQTHQFTSLEGPNEEKVFEAYAEQNTPAAYRVFWYYGPDKNKITVIAITSHP